MFCTKCGKALNNDAQFCQFCGYQINQNINDNQYSIDDNKTEHYKQNLEKLKKKIKLINSFMYDISNLTLNISENNVNLVHIMGDITTKTGRKLKKPIEVILTIPKGFFNSEKKSCHIDTGCTFDFVIPYEDLVCAISVIITAIPKVNNNKQPFEEENNNISYWKKRTKELKDLLKVNTKSNAIKVIILTIFFYPITIPLLFIWYTYPILKNKKITILTIITIILAICTTSQETTNINKKPIKQEYRAPIAEGAYDILPTEFGKGYDKTIKKHGIANIKKSNELLPKAAEIVSKNNTCDKITWVMLSDNKSTKDNLVIITDCNNGKRFFLSEKEIAQKTIALSEYQKLEKLIPTHLAMCETKIKNSLNYPSTYKKLISKTGWETKNYGNDIVIGFKAKNAFNLETEYTARCMLNSSNQFSTFNIKENK